MLLNQYVKGQFSMQYIYTAGVDFEAKELNVDGINIKLQFWDTEGFAKYNSIWASYCRNSDCCVLVFDLTDPKSFESIEIWRNEFLKALNPKDPDTFPFVLIGNKCDIVLERRVQQKKIDEYCATKRNMPYFEVSAKNNKNIDTAFYEVARLIFTPNRAELKATNQQTSKSNFKVDKVEEIFIPNRFELICANSKNLGKKEKESQKLKNAIKQLDDDK